MASPGIIALPVILALGAITGYLTYTYFTDATPDPGIIKSPYWKELVPSSGNQSGTVEDEVDESQYSEVVTVKILAGSDVEGTPDYDPDQTKAGADALIKWVNEDDTLHSATSGKSPSDPESGKLFDSGFINPSEMYSVPAADIGKGEYSYYCQVHPYMTSTITIE